MSLPRSARRSRSPSMPADRGRRTRMRSRRTRPGKSMRPISASAVTLLPEPDSPTMPTTSPGVDIERSTPSTAMQRRAAVEPNSTRQVLRCRAVAMRHQRFSFGSSASRSPSPIRLNASTVIRIARPGNVTTHHARWMNSQRRGQHRAPLRRRRLRAEAEEAERGGIEDRGREAERRLHDQRRGAVGQHGVEHQPQRAGAGDARRRDVVLRQLADAPRARVSRT